MKDNEQKIKPAALLLGPLNSEAVVGDNWRHAKANARALGVRIFRVGKKDFFRVDEYLAALERQRDAGETPSRPRELASADPAEQVRELLRRAGAR